MSPEAATLRPTIDRVWLEQAAAEDPITHALALWDLDHYPDRVQFVSAVRGETTLGYLLVWLGHPQVPIVHWVGVREDARVLTGGLPARPLVAIVPEEVGPDVARVRGPVTAYPLLLLSIEREAVPTATTTPEGIRRLTRGDRPALVALASRRGDLVVSEYSSLDPEAETVWGFFEGGRLRALARAVVRRPSVWIIGGVYVDPSARGRGLGVAIVQAAIQAGVREARTVALFVRADRPAARAVYERAGFRPLGRRVWLDAGADLEP